MTDGDLFSTGFAWAEEAEVSQSVATPLATPESPGFPPETPLIETGVASGAGVAPAALADYLSQESVALDATPVATPKTAEICASRHDRTPAVACVASVANWMEAVATLDEGAVPVGISGREWSTLVRDARSILKTWGRELEEAGWSTLQVFGVPRTPGARRLDCVGLAALVGRRAVLEVTSTHAVIQATPRDRTRFDRRLVTPWGVPLWEWVL